MAQAYLAMRKHENAAPATLEKYDWSLAAIGDELLDRPLDQVTKPEVLTRMRVFVATGHYEKVKRARTLLARIYDFADGEGYEVAKSPAAKISGSLPSPRVKHHPVFLDPARVGEFLRAVDAYKADPGTMILLRLSPLIVLRSKEIRDLRWGDVSWEDNLIRIPGERMKITKDEPRDHLVPIAPQTRQVLEDALPWTSPKGPKGRDTLVMQSLRAPGKKVSENTFNIALQRMGFPVGEATHHGLRTTFSTWANEGSWHEDWIETQLHHAEPNAVRGSYNAAIYIDGRRELMTWWANELDKAKALPPRT